MTSLAAAAIGTPSPDAFTVARLADDVDLTASLRNIASTGCDLLASCSSSSVTLIRAHRPSHAATSALSNELDQLQHDLGDGPCLTAARDERFVALDMTADAEWASFRAEARRRGVAGSISIPLLFEDPDLFGALNAYRTTSAPVPQREVTSALRFSAHASVLVENALGYWAARDLSRDLAAALEHRSVIEQAKGIVMGTCRCSPDEAFEALRSRSQAENRKLRDVAADLVATTQVRRSH